ncbi:hypothetical protein [Streptomyces sp. CB01580]|uniref:hypothetical protein n=1 Tax=Streptomyces sp. CB01580 TaxID=1703933 RepID=UPI001A8F2F14|nr:hypothetical protein [Streptomyces sp. CB01580]
MALDKAYTSNVTGHVQRSGPQVELNPRSATAFGAARSRVSGVSAMGASWALPRMA